MRTTTRGDEPALRKQVVAELVRRNAGPAGAPRPLPVPANHPSARAQPLRKTKRTS